MDVPFWVWALTVGAIVGMLIFDFVGHVRTPHAPSLRESSIWSAVYVGIAIVFGLLIFWFAGADYGGQYFAGYITEKSLSIDNLFVFVLIMASFGVPRELQQKVLLFGITFALILRTVFIVVGAAAIVTTTSVNSWTPRTTPRSRPCRRAGGRRPAEVEPGGNAPFRRPSGAGVRQCFAPLRPPVARDTSHCAPAVPAWGIGPATGRLCRTNPTTHRGR